MPRLQLTDEEALLIETYRKENSERIAMEKVIDWCHTYLCDRAGASTNDEVAEIANDMVRTAKDLFLVKARRR